MNLKNERKILIIKNWIVISFSLSVTNGNGGGDNGTIIFTVNFNLCSALFNASSSLQNDVVD